MKVLVVTEFNADNGELDSRHFDLDEVLCKSFSYSLVTDDEDKSKGRFEDVDGNRAIRFGYSGADLECELSRNAVMSVLDVKAKETTTLFRSRYMIDLEAYLLGIPSPLKAKPAVAAPQGQLPAQQADAGATPATGTPAA